jgi:hypothetical protein
MKSSQTMPFQESHFHDRSHRHSSQAALAMLLGACSPSSWPVLSSALVGLIVGCVITVLQHLGILPLILKGEVY